MTYVIGESCADVLDRTCVEECPVDCIYEGKRMLYIHPDECVDCGACEPVCPVEAIYYEDDLPEKWQGYTGENAPVLRRATARPRRPARLARRRGQAGPGGRGYTVRGRAPPAAVTWRRRAEGRHAALAPGPSARADAGFYQLFRYNL